jgi:sulfonate transport system substrate-binding protein
VSSSPTRWFASPLVIALATAVLAAALALALVRHGGQPVVLHVGDQRGSTRSLLQSAGELNNVPYKIEWDVFPVGAPLIEAMKAGAVDFGYVGSSTMTFGLASNAPLKAINVWRMQGPGSGILVRGDGAIRSLADLRGKRIAVVRGSPGHLLVIAALQKAAIPLDQVHLVFLSAGDAKAALSSGAIDGWAIWDPYLAIGERQDHDRVLVTSDQLIREVECGVASQAAIDTKRAQLLDFIGRVRRANQWAQAHPDLAAQAYARETGVPLEIAEIVRRRMHVDVLPAVSDEAIAVHQQAADIYAQVGLIPHRLDIAKVYDRSFVIPAN